MENGKRSRGNSHDSKNSEEKMVDEEEKKEDTENGLNEFGFGFTEDDVKPNEESSDDEETMRTNRKIMTKLEKRKGPFTVFDAVTGKDSADRKREKAAKKEEVGDSVPLWLLI